MTLNPLTEKFKSEFLYVHVRDGEYARTLEMEAGNIFFDVDAEGRVLGIEVLVPSTVTLMGVDAP